jgi:hypothetical protein
VPPDGNTVDLTVTPATVLVDGNLVAPDDLAEYLRTRVVFWGGKDVTFRVATHPGADPGELFTKLAAVQRVNGHVRIQRLYVRHLPAIESLTLGRQIARVQPCVVEVARRQR